MHYLANFLRFSAEVPRDLKHKLTLAQTIFKEQVKRMLGLTPPPANTRALAKALLETENWSKFGRKALEDPSIVDVSSQKQLSAYATAVVVAVKKRVRQSELTILRRRSVATKLT